MKKLFTLIMGAFFALNIAQAETINVNLSSGSADIIISDMIETDGGWEIQASSPEFYVFLAVYDDNVTELAGTYTAEQLSENDSFVGIQATGDRVFFTSGSITIAVAGNGDVTITGALVGEDGNTYNLNISFVAPRAERTVTFYFTGADAFDLGSEVGIAGEAQNGSAYIYLRLVTDMEHLSGTFSGNSVDVTSCSVEVDYEDYIVYSATVNVVSHGNGNYTVTADLLCYNNTLYKVTLIVGAPQGLEDAGEEIAPRKVLRNGQVLIQRSDKTFTLQGQEM